MATFQSVNAGLQPRTYIEESTTPTTPRALQNEPPPSQPSYSTEESTPTTPTRNTFGGVLGQKPLPNSPFSASFPTASPQKASQPAPNILVRGDSHRSVRSTESQDVDMEDSDEGEGASDGESIDGESGRPSKKKKGQRFFCTDFPPCNLSFTRSEHLARHIRFAPCTTCNGTGKINDDRKHTGERPFQCHCARRFSRLDNLRQHAQTVHVNEEIPGDSLAATGTRFQRQIRTDRMRPSGSRSRASTVSSQGSHGRGHSRNLSSSSIGSNASSVNWDDARRRPPPLIMAHDSPSRGRLTIDTMRTQPTTPPGPYGFTTQSPRGPSTPTSSIYSNGPVSPGYGSSLGSPISALSAGGLWGGRTPGRRLSVPSGANPFQPSHGHTYPVPHLSPLAPSNGYVGSNTSSVYASPTNSSFSHTRRESASAAAAEAEFRRRTWHPPSYSSYPRPATSGLSYYQTPDAPRPAFAPQAASAASQPHRLPGIETFDQLSHKTIPSPRRSSPMQIDTPSRPPLFSGPSNQTTTGPNDRRGHASWDMSLHQNLTKLDITSGTPPKDSGNWGQQTIMELQNAGTMNSVVPSRTAPQPHPVTVYQDSNKRLAENENIQPATARKYKRQGWYRGPLLATQAPVAAQRTSPEDSSSSEGVPTPSTSSAEYHPSIIHSNGYIEPNNASSVAVAAQNVRLG